MVRRGEIEYRAWSVSALWFPFGHSTWRPLHVLPLLLAGVREIDAGWTRGDIHDEGADYVLGGGVELGRLSGPRLRLEGRSYSEDANALWLRMIVPLGSR